MNAAVFFNLRVGTFAGADHPEVGVVGYPSYEQAAAHGGTRFDIGILRVLLIDGKLQKEGAELLPQPR